jgi:hypothetical protein
MKNEHPNTVIANEIENTNRPGNRLIILKVNHDKLIIKIHERLKSISLFGTSTYFEENKLNPTTRKLIFNEKTGFNKIVYKMKLIVKKIPSIFIKYALIKIRPNDLIFGKNE